jgi:KaiC/GvpD/RAD55 family RecA-like ATPase
MNKKIVWIVSISFSLLLCIFGAEVNAPAVSFSGTIWVSENYPAQQAARAASLESIEVDHVVTRSSQENSTQIIGGGGHQMLQFSSVSNSSFTRHMMCKNYDLYYSPIEPTTTFRPSDTKAVCLTTVSIKDRIEFRWYYRSDSSKTWVSCYNWSQPAIFPGEYREYHYEGHLLIEGYWPGLNYPRAYKLDVYLDYSLGFSEFFEITNGGLNSPRMCEDVDVNGNPVNVKSRFRIGADTKAQHFLRFDKNAYFNERLGHSHNFTTVWIQPDGSTYRTYSNSITDYKDTNITWNYWKYGYTTDDYISINSSTPVGNWNVEVYLDSYYLNNTWIRYGPIATTPFIVGSEPVADWTFMVYLDADSSLEAAGIDVFSKMASVGSSSQVNIVIQMDKNSTEEPYDTQYGNWTDCKRFNVTKGMTPTPGNATLHLGEVNMGHPDTLKDFVNWTINHYPANYYFLVLWGHGTGCMGVCFDVTNETDALSLPELSQALSGLPATMDVILIDACSMSMTEIAYQIKDYANVLVAPEGLGYSPAPYDRYLSSLTSNPSMPPSEFASAVVTSYIDWCKNSEYAYRIQNATMSAIDLTKIMSLTAAIDDFALKLKENENFYNYLINSARNQTEGYEGPFANQIGYYIDLYHFAMLTNQSVLDEELQNTADQVMTTLESIIIIEEDKASPHSHGLSIFFPDQEDKYLYSNFETLYEDTTFAGDTPWDEFVKYYLNIQTSGCVLTIKTTYRFTPVKINDKSYTTDDERKLQVFILPGSYTINVTTSVLTEPDSRGIFKQWKDGDKSNPRTIHVLDKELTLESEYTTQYCLTVNTDPSDLTPQPEVSPQGLWYDEDDRVRCDAQEISGYVFEYWTVDGISQGAGINPLLIDMNEPHEAIAHYMLASAWWAIFLRPDVLQIVGLLGIGLTATLVGNAWVRTHRRRGVIKAFLNEIDEVYSRFKMTPRKCEEELSRLRDVILERLTEGKITKENHSVLDKRIEEYMGGLKSIMKARAEPVAIEVSEVLPDRITTGHGDLDNLLFGGIPKNYAVILTSPSCDEKDLLIKKFLEAGAEKGEVTFYVTIDPGEVRGIAEEFQSHFYVFICNPQADKIMESLPNVFKLDGVENLTEISIAFTKAFRGLDDSITGPRRACIEIVSDVLLQHHAVQTRRWLTELLAELKSRGFTTLAVINPYMHPSEEVHAILDLSEGEINIYEKESEKGLEKFVRIQKMFNQRYLGREMPLKKEKLKAEKSGEKSKQK